MADGKEEPTIMFEDEAYSAQDLHHPHRLQKIGEVQGTFSNVQIRGSFVSQSCEAREVVMPYDASKGLFLSVLPKGNVPPSGPSDKGHTSPPKDYSDQHMVQGNSPEIYRQLGSVPSPGVGN
ncbi:unnamed protein product [Brassica oleracea var. botrytis]